MTYEPRSAYAGIIPKRNSALLQTSTNLRYRSGQEHAFITTYDLANRCSLDDRLAFGNQPGARLGRLAAFHHWLDGSLLLGAGGGALGARLSFARYSSCH